MIALHQHSNTSPMKPLIASSVCGLVGLFGVLVLGELDELIFEDDVEDGFEAVGTDV